MRGAHPSLDAPIAGETYVAGLDVAGEAASAGQEASHDASVLTIARVVTAATSELSQGSGIEVVKQLSWTGVPHTQIYGALVSLLRETWHVRRLAVDATGIGEPVAAFLANALGRSRVQSVKLTAERKSSLGYELLTAVNGGRLRLPAGASGEAIECWRQLERCRAVYRANQTLNYYVEARDGHDDHVISLALVVAAAADSAPRPARGRLREG